MTASTNDGDLRRAMRVFGSISDAEICRDYTDGSCTGTGFVIYNEARNAVMAVRHDGVVIDSKLCRVRSAAKSVPGASAGGRSTTTDDSSLAEARAEVNRFITQNELSGAPKFALQGCDPKAALHVVRNISQHKTHITGLPGLVLTQVREVSKSFLDDEVEDRINDWTSRLSLGKEQRDGIGSMLIAQRPEEIDYILDQANKSKQFVVKLCSMQNPASWLLSRIKLNRNDKTQAIIENFCRRFNLPPDSEENLKTISSEAARRLMQNWEPAARTSQMERFLAFDRKLKEALDTHRQRAFARASKVTAAAHSTVMEEWSEEEDAYLDEAQPDKAGPGRRKDVEGETSVFDASWEKAQRKKEKELSAMEWLGPEHFTIHSGGTSQSTGTLQKRLQRKPTHFVLCVDTSGSMDKKNCSSDSSGGDFVDVTRLQAVLQTIEEFIQNTAENFEDIYSLVTFNEQCDLHFTCKKSVDALVEMLQLKIVPEKQTFYAVGIRGIEAAIKRDTKQLPAYVLFLSDGEPTDPREYMRDLTVLCRKHPGDTMKIYTIGFGESSSMEDFDEDVPFHFLQQMASIGRGHFQRSGANLQSLKGAFTSISSTISMSRSSGKRDSSSAARRLADPSSLEASVVRSQQATATQLDNIWEEVSSDEDEDGHGGGKKEEVEVAEEKAVPMPQIDWVLPIPREMFKNPNDKSLWIAFRAAQTAITFDGKSFSKKANMFNIHIRKNPFLQGAMRLVYCMFLGDGAKKPENKENWMCGKRLSKEACGIAADGGFQSQQDFCRCTAVAQHFAKMFRQDLRVKLKFVDCHLYSPIQDSSPDAPTFHFCGEAWLHGQYTKLNSNAGFVNESDFHEHSEICQAFSHFTFDRSHGDLLVVDLQGVCAGGSGNPQRPMSMVLTDPQVHTRNRKFERFGAGDLEEKGVLAFFQKHVCNSYCEKLRLKPHTDLCPPTAKLRFPGVPDCLKFLMRDGKTFFAGIRSECKMSSIKVPPEVYAEWNEITMWGSRKGGKRAIARFESRLNEYYEKNREVVSVKTLLPWSKEEWQSKLADWRRLYEPDGVRIIAAPHDWQERRSLVAELWVFGWGDSEERQYAVRGIQKTLDEADRQSSKEPLKPGLVPEPAAAAASTGAQSTADSSWQAAGAADAASSAAAAAPQAAAKTWAKHRNVEDGRAFWLASDGTWFYADDQSSDWTQYLDKAGHPWWWNDKTGDWFLEPQ
eukprot:TRINITY_DN51102_c0_g1_i2.p1 TRINITY_DN51102_c0_g1~~TRINITY_DN51102_c0_g1_i2.p1  ORF type:complete len:1212 (+),score=347.18 TRINITY_DN51102_c0_g1_i2:229-3864(+)